MAHSFRIPFVLPSTTESNNINCTVRDETPFGNVLNSASLLNTAKVNSSIRELTSLCAFGLHHWLSKVFSPIFIVCKHSEEKLLFCHQFYTTVHTVLIICQMCYILIFIVTVTVSSQYTRIQLSLLFCTNKNFIRRRSIYYFRIPLPKKLHKKQKWFPNI